MIPKVKELLDKKIEEERAKELQRRNEHLISLGLVYEDKIERNYIRSYEVNAKFDSVKELYYIEKNTALEVTDEEYAEICKHFPEKENEDENDYKEQMLRDDVKTIKSWVKFWSIFTILTLAIVFIVFFIGISYIKSINI